MPQLQNSGKNKVALITGAGGGIGSSTALLLAKNDYDVAINYLQNKYKTEEITNQARKFEVQVIVVKANLGSEQKIADMFLTI